jgi:hypothetical protein
MVASTKTRRVVCTIVRVAEEPAAATERLVRKPSTLLPWADPYIAGLVRRVQSEVRMERAAMADGVLKHASPVADLDPPSPMTEEDFEWFDVPRFDFDRDIPE